MASFLVILDSGEQKLVASQKVTILIGRMHECDIRLDDPAVSRIHTEISVRDGSYFIRDLDSKNGTFVNDSRLVSTVKLIPGDIIGVGNVKVMYAPPESYYFDRESDEAGRQGFSLESTPRQQTAPLEFLETMAYIARLIVQEQSLEGLLDSVLMHCIEKTGAERAAIMLVDDKGSLSPCAYRSSLNLNAPFVISRSIALKAMTEDRALLIKDVALDGSIQMNESIAGLKIRSAICSPMWNGKRTVGILYLDAIASGYQFGESDLLFFSALAGMVAEKIENDSLAGIAREKRRLDVELGIAVDIQSRLLPMSIPCVAGYDLSAFNRPCTEMGGDYFDIIAAGNNRYVLVIADVIGKGIGAAMLMSNLQAMVRSIVSDYHDPSVIMGKINSDLSSRIGDGMFITCCYLILSPEEGDILYANAGHNQPLLCRNNGDMTELEVSGIPLGILGESTYETFSIVIKPGDVLMLYTDGITECADKTGELFGVERLKGVIARAAAEDAVTIRTSVCAAVENFRDGQPHADDMTFVVVKRREMIS